jgi:hypothetical protein
MLAESRLQFQRDFRLSIPKYCIENQESSWNLTTRLFVNIVFSDCLILSWQSIISAFIHIYTQIHICTQRYVHTRRCCAHTHTQRVLSLLVLSYGLYVYAYINNSSECVQNRLLQSLSDIATRTASGHPIVISSSLYEDFSLADLVEWCIENKSLSGSLSLLFSQLDMIIVGQIHNPIARRLARGSVIVPGDHRDDVPSWHPVSLLIL